MSLFYLVEEDSPALHCQEGKAIALSPWAAQSLKSRGVPYQILEDFYSEIELRAGEDAFFEKQLDWFRQLDTFLNERIPLSRENRWSLASVHLNRMKYLIDSLIIRLSIAEKFLDRAGPSALVFAGTGAGEEPPASLYEFNRHDRWSYAPLLKALAIKRQIKWAEKQSAPSLQAAPQASSGQFSRSWMRQAKKIRNLFFYGKQARRVHPGTSPLRFLFLDAGVASMDDLIRDCIRNGHSVYLKQEKNITALHSLKEERWTLETPAPVLTLPETERLERDFHDSNLGRSFSTEFAIDLCPFLKPCWHAFFHSLLPGVLDETAQVSGFLKKHRIDAVVSRASVGRNYPPALLAAGGLGIPRICFQHSAGPADMKDWVFDELAFFDFNFAMSGPLARYFQAQNQPRYPDCKVLESSPILNRFSGCAKEAGASEKRKPEKLLYVPVKLAGGMSHFNTMFYPMTWYFEYQTKILSYLASRTDYSIIYKHAWKQEWADRSVIPWLKQLGARNITLVQGLYSDFIEGADRVFFDYPSTGLFESAAYGLPVLALHHAAMKIWPPMQEVFGPSLQEFRTPEEAVKILRDYLDRPGHEFRPSLPLRPGTSYDHLMQAVPEIQAHAQA